MSVTTERTQHPAPPPPRRGCTRSPRTSPSPTPSAALEFYADAFGAVPARRADRMPDGRIGHAELAFGDSC